MLVNKAITPITYMTICHIPCNRTYHHTIATTATNTLIQRSNVHSFLFMKIEKRIKEIIYALVFLHLQK